MIEKHRAELGITPRKISDEEIVQRLRLRAGQRGRASILEEGIALRASRHRHGLPHRLRLPAATAAGRCTTPTTVGLFNVVPGDEALRRQPARRREVLAAGAAAGEARRRRQDLQLTTAAVRSARAARHASSSRWPSRSASKTLAARLRGSSPSRRRRRWRSMRRPRRAARGGGALQDDRLSSTMSTRTRPSSWQLHALPAAAASRRRTRCCSSEVIGKYGLLYTWPGSDPKAAADRADGAPGRGADRAGHRGRLAGRAVRRRRSRTASSGAAARWDDKGNLMAQHGGGRDAASPRGFQPRQTDLPGLRRTTRRSAACAARCRSPSCCKAARRPAATSCSTKAC